MGCDIHGVVEVHAGGKWLTVLVLADLSPRNYALFSLLFGVRGGSPYEYKYRGFPVDMSWHCESAFCRECEGKGHAEATLEMKEQFHKYSPGVKECEVCCDWHSVTWITMQEIEAHWEEVAATLGKGERWRIAFDTMRFLASYLPEHAQVIESTAALSTGKEDTSRVRMVVWFDN